MALSPVTESGDTASVSQFLSSSTPPRPETSAAHMSTADPTMKKKKTKTQPAKTGSKDVILQLPNPIIVDIFCKIPTKKILQFKTVCKSWLYLLSDPQFAKDLFSQTSSCFMMHSNNPTGMVIVDPENASTPDCVSLRVPQPPNADPSWRHYIVGSSNGLLCIHHTRYMGNKQPNFYDFYLFHPITGETIALPRLKNVKKGGELRAYGFGFSPITCVYKLLVILPSARGCDESKAMILTVGSNSWRTIGSCKDPGWPPQEMIYLNGSLHWNNRLSTYLIRAFDIEGERFQEFQLPSALSEFSQHYLINKLGVLGGYPSFTGYKMDDLNICGVWVMKEYGVKESWTKEFDFRNLRGPKPLTLSHGKLILTSYAEGICVLMVCTPGTSNIERIDVVGMPKDYIYIRLFVPSLVSLKDILCVC